MSSCDQAGHDPARFHSRPLLAADQSRSRKTHSLLAKYLESAIRVFAGLHGGGKQISRPDGDGFALEDCAA
jgi:hypothetical protein